MSGKNTRRSAIRMTTSTGRGQRRLPAAHVSLDYRFEISSQSVRLLIQCRSAANVTISRRFISQTEDRVSATDEVLLRFQRCSAARCHTTEANLVRDVSRGLSADNCAIRVTSIRREFRHESGTADLVGLGRAGEVVALEAKLHNWRVALHQAYKNTAFAHSSYVAMPLRHALLAYRYVEEFDLRRVGLIGVRGKQCFVLIRAQSVKPILPWLTARVRSHITSG